MNGISNPGFRPCEAFLVLDDIFSQKFQSKSIVTSVLARAFRGEFGVEDENDETVVHLLRDALEFH